MKFLLILVLLIILYFRFVKGQKRVCQKKERKELITELVFDENCGTYINKNSAIRIKFGDKEYYFCSKKCAEEFLKKLQDSQ